MYIYNITTNIEESVQEDWLHWMRDIHIPEMLATGKFSKALMTKVIVEEEMGGSTFSVQYTTNSRETLDKYYEEDADRLANKGTERFGGKFVVFSTELALISEH
ncbi:MAG TPA: DUF4286 family protein [Arenibacter sp.]|nr:DUF4286 family protein [Arenibacter sp.]